MFSEGARSSSNRNFDTQGQLGPDRFSAEEKAVIKKELALAVSDVPKGGFSSEAAAAKYLRTKLQPIAENYDIEIGSYIFSNNGGDSFNVYQPITGFYNHVIPNALMDSRIGIAPFHTHQTAGNFSGADLGFAELSRANSYLSNTSGLWRYRTNDFIKGYNNGGSKNRGDYVDFLGN